MALRLLYQSQQGPLENNVPIPDLDRLGLSRLFSGRISILPHAFSPPVLGPFINTHSSQAMFGSLQRAEFPPVSQQAAQPHKDQPLSLCSPPPPPVTAKRAGLLGCHCPQGRLSGAHSCGSRPDKHTAVSGQEKIALCWNTGCGKK